MAWPCALSLVSPPLSPPPFLFLSLLPLLHTHPQTVLERGERERERETAHSLSAASAFQKLLQVLSVNVTLFIHVNALDLGKVRGKE